MCHGPDVDPMPAVTPLSPGGNAITLTLSAPSPWPMIAESQLPPIQKTPLPFANSAAEASFLIAL